jgi:hypothetical protein
MTGSGAYLFRALTCFGVVVTSYDADLVEQFWARVDRTGGRDDCWSWLGTTHANGYGVVNLGRRQELAHRLALTLSGIEIPPGFVVMRSCGNRLCCNPAHLQVSTPAQLMATRAHQCQTPRSQKDGEARGPS